MELTMGAHSATVWTLSFKTFCLFCCIISGIHCQSGSGVAEFSVQNKTLTVQETDEAGNTVDVCIELTFSSIQSCIIIEVEGYPISSNAEDFDISLSANITFCPQSYPVQCVQVGIRGDDIVEGTEQFSVVFSSDDNRTLIIDNTTIISIIDDDGVLLEKLPTTNIFENSTMNRSLCVRLIDIGEGLQRSVHVSVMFIPNLFPYAEERDFELNNTSQYFTSTSMVNDTLCWNFYPQNDDRVEANEVFSFNISTSNGLDTFLGVSLCDITIYDDDGALFVIDSTTIASEGDSLDLCLETNNTIFERNSTIRLQFLPMGYANYEDLTIQNYVVTFQHGTSGFSRLCFFVNILNDNVAENSESFEFVFIPDNSRDYIDPPSFSFQVTDNNGAALILESTSNINEMSTMVRELCVRLNSTMLQRDVAINIFFDDYRSSYANSDDFYIDNVTLVFNSSLIGEELCWTFIPRNDLIPEITETFYFEVRAENPSDYFIDNNRFFNLSIYDDNDGAALILEPTSNINEMSTMVRELCVSLNSTMLQRDVAINIFFDDYRSSYANSDDFYIDNVTLVFNSSLIGEELCWTFQPRNDLTPENTETFYFEVRAENPSDYFIDNNRFFNLSIYDDNDGAALILEPTSNINEMSTMVRELCVRLNSSMLQRDVAVNIYFDDYRSSYANTDDFYIDNVTLVFNSSLIGEELCWTFQPRNDLIPENTETFYFEVRTENPLDYFIDNNRYFNLSIYDDNDGAALILEPTSNINEMSTMVRELCVRLNSSIQRDVAINIFFDDYRSSYANSDDFYINNVTLVFNSSLIGEELCWTFIPRNDIIPENNETFYFEVRAENPLDYFIDNNRFFNLSIYDDNDGAALILEPTSNINEMSTMVRELCVRLNSSMLQRDVAVNIFFDDYRSSYANSDDFYIGNVTLVFNSSLIGEELCWTFIPRDDQIPENTETFYFEVKTENPSDYFIDNNRFFNLSIYDDNDGAALILEPTSNINEMSTMVRELCVRLNSTMLQRDVAVNIFFDDYRSSYANSDDFYIDNVTLVFNSSLIGEELCWTFQPRNDLTPENTETFYFEVRTENPDDYFPDNNRFFNLSIYDDNDGAALILEPTSNINEMSTMVRELCVRLNSTMLQRDVAVNIFFDDRSSYANSDDFYIDNVTLVFNSSLIGEELCWTFQPRNDIIPGNNETFYFEVRAENPSDYFIDNNRFFHLSIYDDNDGAALILEPTSNINEMSTMVRELCVRLNSTLLQRDVAVNIFFDDKSSYANSDDFYIDNVTLVFNSSLIGEALCWTFQPRNDLIPENNETFYFEVRAENPSDYFIDNNRFFHLSIYDDNDGAALILEPTSNINEMSTMVRELCVSLNSSMLQRDVAVNIFFDDYRSSSYANSDDFYIDNVTLVFNSSLIGEKLCWTFQPMNDIIPENNETFYFEVRAENPSDYFIDNNRFFYLSIYDDNDGAALILEPTSNINEMSTMVRELCVRLNSSMLQRDVAVNIFFDDRSSYANSDDFYIDNVTLVFNSSLIGEELCWTFQPRNDQIPENTETFYFEVRAENPSDYFIDNNRFFHLSIYDDNDAVQFAVQNTTLLVKETDVPGNSVNVCIELTDPSIVLQLCITLEVKGQSISSFADQCNIDLSTNVTFCPGSDPVQCVSVGIRGDDIVEGTEQFAVVFSSDDGHVVITDNTTIVSVIDDDGVLLEIIPTSNIFENSTMSRDLCVRLIDIGEGLERNVPVSIMFIANLFPYAEMRDFMLNNTSQYFTSTSMVNDTLCWNFYPQNDDRVEADEVFSFNISTFNELDTFTGGSLLDITIYDDDGAMFVAENVGTVTEGDLVNLCLVTNNTVFERNSTVNLAFQPMGYSDEDDIMIQNNVVTFQAGTIGYSQLCFSVYILSDNVAESIEMFEFILIPNNSRDYTNPPSFSFEVTANDGARLILEPTSNINENSTMTRELCVKLNSTMLQRDVAINIFFGNNQSGFANSDDFDIDNVTLVFNSSLIGEELCWTFQPRNDQIPENTETFYFEVRAENPLDYFIDNNRFFHLSIYDDNDGALLQVQPTTNITENSTMVRGLCVTLQSMELQREVIVNVELNRTSSAYAMTADFNIEGTMLVFNSSHVGQTLCASFEPVNDLIVEATECFYFIATAQYMRDVFTDAVTQVCIIDNDGARIQLEPTSNTSENSNMTSDLCVSLNSTELQREVVIDLTFDENRGSGYAKSSDFGTYRTALTFDSTNVNAVLCSLFIPVNDEIVEDTESFYFQETAQNALDYFVDGNSVFHLSVYDDDGAMIVLQPTQNISENSTMMRELCVQLNQVMLERTVPVSIRFLADSGPYATSDDFILYDGPLEFNSSTSDEELCFVFRPKDDMIVEDNEVFNFETTTANSLDSFANNNSLFSVTIYDDDGAKLVLQPTVNIFENSTTNRELCILLNQNSSNLQREVIISIMFLKDPTSFANATDFTLDRNSLTFSPSTAAEECFSFDPIDDMIIEDSELFKFLIEAQNSRDYFSGGNSSFQIYVYDDDGLLLATEPTMNIREDSVMTRQLCIASQENGELERNVSVSLSLISSGYGIEDDYMILENSVFFPPGPVMQGATACFTFEPRQDRFIESNETFVFVPSTGNPLDTFLPESNNFTIEIYDDDGAILMFTLSQDTIPEYSNMSIELCVSLVYIGDGLQREVSFRSEFMPFGFSKTTDFNIRNDGYLIFNSSSSNDSIICQYFEPVQDRIVENNETFSFNIILGDSLDMFASGNAFSFVIIDDDGVVLSPSPSQSVATIQEDSSMQRSLCVEITNDGDGIERDIYVELVFRPSNPFTKISDFSLLNNTNRRFPPGSLVNDSLCFEIIPTNDDIIEATENFNFEVILRNMLDGISPDMLLVFIIVDDDGANITLTPSSTSVAEGANFVICASMNQMYQLERDVSLMLVIPESSSDDIEILGMDVITFEPTTNMTMSDAMGQCIEFLASNDSLLEVPEVVSITVNISALEANDIVMPTSIDITILDTDQIQTTDDMLLEIPESFSVEVNVSSLMNFDTVINMASVMILDNDVADVRFEENMLALQESSAENSMLCVNVSGMFTSNYELTLSFSSSSSQDISIINSTLLVTSPGSYCIYVRAIDDDSVESTESHVITVMWVPGDGTSMIPVTITDNDVAFVAVEERDLLILEGQRDNFAEICLSLSGKSTPLPSSLLERDIIGTATNTSYIQSITITIAPTNFSFTSEVCIKVTATDDGTIIANDLRRPLTLELMLNKDSFINMDGTSTPNRTIVLTIIEDDSVLVEGVDFIPFLNLTDDDGGKLNSVEPDSLGKLTSDYTSGPIYPLTSIPIGSELISQLYVTSEGAISFGTRQLEYQIGGFPVLDGNLIAVFLSDHDARFSGSIRYKTYDSDSKNLDTVSRFVQSRQNVTFKGTWMIIAEWRDVPQYRSSINEVNTYELIIVSDSTQTFAVLTYNCDQLQWTGESDFNIGAIGYSLGSRTSNIPEFYNHPLSKRERVKMIACSNVEGDRNRPWTNVDLKIGETTDQMNVNDRRCLEALSEDMMRLNDIKMSAFRAAPCPCSLFQAIFDRRVRVLTFIKDYVYFVPRFPAFTGGYVFGYSCAYSLSRNSFGSLIVPSVDLGTFFFIYPFPAFFLNFNFTVFEVLNFDVARKCCNEANLCDRWIAQRPADNCFRYSPPRRSWFWGDPHFETLDGGNYTFNGWGEYTMLQTMDGFTLQGRTVAVNASDSTSATQFSAFAFGTQNTAVEVRINGTGLQLLLNEEDITDTIPNVNDTNDSNFLVFFERTGDSSISVSFPNQISVTVTLSLGLLSTNLDLPQEFANNVSGLLGNFNGDSSDDLMYPNGTILDLPATGRATNSFGQSWQIDESSSLFTYPPDTTYANFSFPNHMPAFLEDILRDANNSDIIQQCGNNAECIFDATQTGNIEIGLNTMQFDATNIENREELENFPPTINGPAVFQVVLNITSVFLIQVNDTNLQSFNFSNGPIQGGELVLVDSTTYNFTWTPGDMVTSSIIFLAVDQRNASAVYEPIIEVCPCLNGGTCTRGGVENPSANPLFLNCICSPAWEGQICERNFNACTEGLCFEGVSCIDNEAPLEGAICGNCTIGYEGDGMKCEDVNECNGTNPCEQGCTNTAGSFECTCFAGYETFNSTHCRDINECLIVGQCHQICTNTEGSFRCTCNPGFQLQSDNFTCAVLPENMCIMINCTQLCVRDTQTDNENCSCRPGYELNMEDGVICDDLNECSGELSPCAQNCTDTDGSFDCSCLSGFMQDGTQCNDIDECEDAAVAQMSLCGESMLCNNTEGGFECICPAGTQLFDNICEIPPTPTEAPSTSIPSRNVMENTVVITLIDISVEMFDSELQERFRMEVAMGINMFCSDSNNRDQCSFQTIVLSKRQIMIISTNIAITNIMAAPTGNGTTFHLYVLGVGQATVLSQQAVLNAINNYQQALMSAGFNFVVVPLIPITTQTIPTSTPEPTGGLTPGEIAGIVIAGIAGAILLFILLASCIYWCYSRRRTGKIVFNTYGREPTAKSTLKSLHLRGGDMVEENMYVTRKDDKDAQSMQSVQLEFMESRSEPSPQLVDPPDYDEVTRDKDKVNLVEEDEEDKGGLPQFDIRISFIEDADKDTAL